MTPEPKRGIDHGSVILAHEARMDNFADELREMRREGREDRKQIHERIRELEVSLDHKLDAWGHQLAQDIRVSRNANGSRVPPWIYLLVGGALMLGGEGLKMIWTLLEQALG